MAIGNAFRAPTVSGLNSAGWWLNDRKMHVERRIVFWQKVRKTRNFGKNMDNLAFWRAFRMTSA